jgi:uncharacterized protein (DUF58 family)
VRPELAAAVRSFRLAAGPARWRGRSGSRRGLGIGSSQEFLDFRDYAPGDDLRHLDWRTYARTDQLKIKLFHEEVAPHVDVLVDASASMAVTPGKERAARDLALAFVAWAGHEGSRARCLALGGAELADAETAPFAGAAAIAMPASPLRARGLRVVLADFLQADDPAPILRRLAAGAAGFVAVQLLDPWERSPSADETLTLRDCETDARLELRLDEATVRAYRERLQRLTASVRDAVVAIGGRFAAVTAAPPAAMFRGDLLAAQVLEPAT